MLDGRLSGECLHSGKSSTDIHAPNTSNTPTTYTPCTFPYIVSPNLSTAYINFITNCTSAFEPHSYEQARISNEWV